MQMKEGIISVDKWREESRLYFLTHMHADHIQGLTSNWSKGPLFCSLITAKLFPSKFPNFDLSLLIVLDIGSWHSIPIPSSSLSLEVLAIDAHHCPGAVMFLFRGEFGCILYTGDFRWELDSMRAMDGRTLLIKALKGDAVDVVYLDNTYCNPSYDFPPRHIAAQQIVDIITCHPAHDIIIGIDTLGKEDLLIHISKALNIKIWVWPERLETMHQLGYHEIFTTDTSLTRVRAVPRYSLSVKTLEALNTMRATLGIMASGLPWLKKFRGGGDGTFSGSFLTSRYKKTQWSANDETKIDKIIRIESIAKLHKYIFLVPYSDHSCFTEIKEFIKLVQPKKVKGIVSSSSQGYVDPTYYLGRLCGGTQSSQGSQYENKVANRGERFFSVHTKFPKENVVHRMETKRKDNKVNMLGVRKNRVNAAKMSVRGAKIAEYDSADR
ncbi:hypothetical protein ACFE04_029736 [Oxalis oulophora]